MKNNLYLILILFLTACFFGHNNKDDLPSFNILLDSTIIFNTKNIQEGKISILLFFSPDCEHCQWETEGILKNMDSLKQVQFYFITIDPLDRMKVFNRYYKLFQYPNITVGRDYTYFFIGHFKQVIPPYLLIYDQHKRLKAVCKGQVTTNQLISIVNKL